MAHKMFERVKKIIALQAPTRNISTPTSLGRSARDVARSYASVGVLAVFVAGVASPAVLAGAEDEAARPAETAAVALAENDGTPASLKAKREAAKRAGNGPAGGGAPAPRSADPQPAEGAAPERSEGEQPAEGAPAEAEPAAHGGGAQPPAEPAVAEPVDELDGWIRQAIGVMKEHGVTVSEEDIGSIRTVVEKESSGDPNAINLWDINAKRGTPSKGLMQTIDTTFEAHKIPGYDNIYDPVANIIAGTRYTLSRYGSFTDHPGLASMAGGSGYRGY